MKNKKKSPNKTKIKIKSLLLSIARRTVFFIGCLRPVKKERIVVSSFYGRGYGDNIKYIVECLMEKSDSVEIIWLTRSKEEGLTLPERIKACDREAVKAQYYIASAKIWIDNCRKPIYHKRKKQFYLQVWHGGGAQKKCERDVADKLSKPYVKMAIKDSKCIDLMVSESRFMTQLYYRVFWYNGPVYECGYPRYDIILEHDSTLTTKVYDYFGIPKEKKLLLYAPTFRVDYSLDAYDIDFARLQKNLKKKFGFDYVILVHLHPNIAGKSDGIKYEPQSIINATFYPDMQELIAVSDILIGDYSSVNYDFCLKHSPVFRYASDLEEYKNDRDLYFPFEEYPFPYARSNDELEKLIFDFDEDKYVADLNSFFDKLGSVLECGAGEKLADLILDYMNSKNKQEFFKRNKEKFIYEIK